MISFEDVKSSSLITELVKKGDSVLNVMGFTEHGIAHASKVAQTSFYILNELGKSHRETELVMISAYMHDIGNIVNRVDHAQSGALMAFKILGDMGMETDELAYIVGAIGNHDEGTGTAISNISAALILADKTDVRRTRVRNGSNIAFDIHDRVNYAVTDSNLTVEGDKITLRLEIDTLISPVLDYFEIFLSRMMMCKRASEFLKCSFNLVINNNKIL